MSNKFSMLDLKFLRNTYSLFMCNEFCVNHLNFFNLERGNIIFPLQRHEEKYKIEGNVKQSAATS